MDDLRARRLRALCSAARRSAAVAAADRETRDREIYQAARDGAGEREIQRLTGETPAEQLSLSHVQRIVIRETAAAQAGHD